MREFELRQATLRRLRSKYSTDTLVIEELGLCQGKARIDVAAINGDLHGYEIKSVDDDLRRLPQQIEFYTQCLNKISIVSVPSHVEKIENTVPFFYGILIAKQEGKGIRLVEHRPAELNPDIKVNALIQLVWRDEALAELRKMDLHRGMVSKTRDAIWTRLTESLTLDDVQLMVSRTLRNRRDWRFATRQT